MEVVIYRQKNITIKTQLHIHYYCELCYAVMLFKKALILIKNQQIQIQMYFMSVAITEDYYFFYLIKKFSPFKKPKYLLSWLQKNSPWTLF